MMQERLKLNPWVGGLGMAALIYVITFPRWGGTVVTGSEEPPERRSWRKEIVLAAAPLLFGLGTAVLYGRGPKRSCTEW